MNLSLVDLLSKGWWLLFLRGLASLIFGLLAFAVPGMISHFLILYWAIYILLDGAFTLAASLKGGKRAPKGWLFITGLIGVIAGIFCISNPGYVATIFILLLGWISLIKGVIELVGALALKSHGGSMGMLFVSAILSILFGGWLISHPAAGAVALIWLIATFATLVGVVLIAMALMLRKRAKSLPVTIDV